MNTYRSLDVIQAVQYTGAPIPGVTCSGSDAEHKVSGCDPSRRYHTHVHTEAIGGMTVLRSGDWIYPVDGGPFAVVDDQKFRGRFEVPSIVDDLKTIDTILAEAKATDDEAAAAPRGRRTKADTEVSGR